MKKLKLSKISVAIATILMLAACGDENEFQEEERIGTRNDGATTIVTDEVPILPKKEMRAVWIATVYEIDWPKGQHNIIAQRRLYKNYLDTLVKYNINTVFFQVRSMADAFYESPYEPWSKYITGTRGRSPRYDILKFLIDEAHKRCISFHAWINPYRIAARSGPSASFPKLEASIPKNLTKDYNKIRMYNPALPETRARLDSIVKDLIVKYNVDGVHMDDYFYPSLSGGEAMNDNAEYAKYGKGFSKIEDWRRNNIDLMVKGLHDMIQSVRPEVVFSISPQGNYDNDYNNMYANVSKWMRRRWLEIMIPQIYYPTGTRYIDFNSRLNWWASNAGRCGLLVGYAIYRFDPNSGTPGFRTNAMLKEQFNLADRKSKVTGGVLYNTTSFMRNNCDIKSVIRNRYAQKALVPFYGYYVQSKPNAPSGIQLLDKNRLTWNSEDNCYYAVYRSNGNKKRATLVEVTRLTSYNLPEEGNYFVTAVSKSDNSESPISEIVKYSKKEQTDGIQEIRIK